MQYRNDNSSWEVLSMLAEFVSMLISHCSHAHGHQACCCDMLACDLIFNAWPSRACAITSMLMLILMFQGFATTMRSLMLSPTACDMTGVFGMCMLVWRDGFALVSCQAFAC